MQICASEWAAVFSCPLLCIDGFGGTEIERQLREDLPAKAEESAAAETIDRRDRIGIEDVVLVAIDAVVPVLGVEELEAEA